MVHIERETVELGIRQLLERIEQGGGRERLFKEKLEEMFRGMPAEKTEKFQEVIDSLHMDAAEDDEVFVRSAAAALWAFANENLTEKDLEAAKRVAFVEQGGFTPLNEILSYGTRGNEIHIHLAPAKTQSMGTNLTLVKEGLKELAERIKTDPTLRDIEEITASSWIVASHPHMMEKLGFTMGGVISEEIRRDHFPGDQRDIAECSMSREDVLRIYG